ncbi:MAG: hexose kinase [Clostridia bacterium]|nr:hexose kinase [Clostridia bacterium]
MNLLSLCMNPSVDRTMDCPAFDVRSANRVRFVRDDIGGKGINTAVLASRLGAESILSLLAPEDDRERISSFLRRENIAFSAVPVPGRLRVNLKIRTGGDMVEINEEGAAVPPQAAEACSSALENAAVPGAFCLLTGSLPPGVPEDHYARLIPRLRRKGCLTAVDADGGVLKAALGEKPDLIKPNRQEFTRLTGLRPQGIRECCLSSRLLIARTGIGAVCLSLGGDGAVYVTKNEALYAPALKVPVRSLHGAGDSLLSALCLSLSRGDDTRTALALGCAAAAAAVSLPGTEMPLPEDVKTLFSRVRIENVDI